MSQVFASWNRIASWLRQVDVLRQAESSPSPTRTAWPSSGRLTPGALALLGVAPARGRTFTSEDARPSAAPVAVLSRGFWTRALGADPTVVGTTVRLDGVAHTIIGVLSAELEQAGLFQADVWIPLTADSAAAHDRTDRSCLVVGRLAPGVGFVQAAADLGVVARVLEGVPEDQCGLAGASRPGPRACES